MKRRKPAPPKRNNATRHRRTAAKPEVKILTSKLRRHWKKLNPIDRGDRLRKLLELGCSRRGLGEDLGLSPTTIRRHSTLATLSEEVREAIRAGFSVKKALAQKANADKQRKRLERIALDERTGEISDRLTEIILTFCKTIKGVPPAPISEGALVTFLSEVRNRIWEMEHRGLRRLKLPKPLDLRRRFIQLRPPAVKDDLPLIQLIDWLAILIFNEESERVIWERAIEKAGLRAKELRKPHQQEVRERNQWRLEISAGPPRRRY